MSTFFEKMQQRVNQVRSTVNNAVDVIKVDEETRTTRFNICLECPQLIHFGSICKKCGCAMQAKTWLKGVECPLKKW
jgi:Family of unknown function (DUF6171)